MKYLDHIVIAIIGSAIIIVIVGVLVISGHFVGKL
jgi:hypothetical protein